MKEGSENENCSIFRCSWKPESEEVKKYDLVVIGHCHQNLTKGNVVSVSATGLEGASYLLIEANENSIEFEHIMLQGK